MKYLLLVSLLFFQETKAQQGDSLDYVSWKLNYLNKMFGNQSGKLMPSFIATDLNGKTYRSENLQTKVLFVNLWFASCQPCVEEIPHLKTLYKHFKDSTGFQFYAITFDTRSVAEKFVKEHNINFPVLLVNDSTAKKLNFGRGFPTNMVLNSSGIIQTIYSGIKFPDKEIDGFLRPEIEKLLRSRQ